MIVLTRIVDWGAFTICLVKLQVKHIITNLMRIILLVLLCKLFVGTLKQQLDI